MTTAVQLAQSVAPGVSLGFKNRIINGGMTIDQRNAGASVTVSANDSSTFINDRWQVIKNSSATISAQQTTTAPSGFSNSLCVTVSAGSAVGATNYLIFGQRIEGFNFSDLSWGTAAASSITISFQVRSSLTGTFSVVFVNSENSRCYGANYTISSANTWEAKTITIAGDTTGTWVGATNGIGLSMYFSLGAGSSYQGTAGSWQAMSNLLNTSTAQNTFLTSANTFYITGVQLEVGTAATSFEFRDYGRELQMCQRYYWNANLGSQYWFASPIDLSGPYRRYSVVYPTTMRATPTITLTASTNGSFSGSYPQPESYGDTSAICGCDVTASNYFAWVTSFKASAEL